MSYRIFVSMNIAIIGATEIAESYALAFINAGHDVFLASNEGSKAGINPILGRMEGLHLCSIEQAAEIADLIIIATSPKEVREVAYWLGDVRRKVIIDATANVFDDADEQVRTVSAIKTITGSLHIVKVFRTKGYEQILKPLFRDTYMDMIFVGDSKKAKEITKILARELALNNCYDFGGNDAIPLFNVMTACCRELVKKNIPDSRMKIGIIKH